MLLPLAPMIEMSDDGAGTPHVLVISCNASLMLVSCETRAHLAGRRRLPGKRIAPCIVPLLSSSFGSSECDEILGLCFLVKLPAGEDTVLTAFSARAFHLPTMAAEPELEPYHSFNIELEGDAGIQSILTGFAYNVAEQVFTFCIEDGVFARMPTPSATGASAVIGAPTDRLARATRSGSPTRTRTRSASSTARSSRSEGSSLAARCQSTSPSRPMGRTRSL